MNKTIVLMSQSSAGKDTAIQYISKKYNIPIAISNTTRPLREGEIQGVEYNFMTKEEFDKYEYPIPPRVYHTIYGDWYYGTNPDVNGKILILDFTGTKSLCDKLGRNNIIVIKINISKSVAKQRAMNRGDDLSEINRRLIDDEKVFKGSDEFADYIINNNGTLEEFKKSIDTIIERI